MALPLAESTPPQAQSYTVFVSAKAVALEAWHGDGEQTGCGLGTSRAHGGKREPCWAILGTGWCHRRGILAPRVGRKRSHCTHAHNACPWGHLGPILWPSGGHVGPSGSHVGPCWGHLGPSAGHLGAILGDLGAILGHLGAILGSSGANLEPSWGPLGSHLLGHLGIILGPSWAIVGAPGSEGHHKTLLPGAIVEPSWTIVVVFWR